MEKQSSWHRRKRSGIKYLRQLRVAPRELSSAGAVCGEVARRKNVQAVNAAVARSFSPALGWRPVCSGLFFMELGLNASCLRRYIGRMDMHDLVVKPSHCDL